MYYGLCLALLGLEWPKANKSWAIIIKADHPGPAINLFAMIMRESTT